MRLMHPLLVLIGLMVFMVKLLNLLLVIMLRFLFRRILIFKSLLCHFGLIQLI